MALLTIKDLLPRRLPSGKVKQQRPKGSFRALRTTDSRPIQPRYAPPTEQNLKRIWQKWTSFCEDELTEDGAPKLDPVLEAERLDRELDINIVEVFLDWFLDQSDIKHLDSVMVRCREWRMAFRHHLGRQINDCFITAMKSCVQGPLKIKYELSELKQFKATMDDDDLFAVLYHHWALCSDYYPIERQRLQHALIILLCAGTSARPGTLIEGSGYYGENDALKYSDIKVHLVRDPEDPKRKFVLMLITLRLLKGKRNAGAPPTFVFYERPETPCFCVVSHVLALAFDDEAFLSPYIKTPEDVWSAYIPPHRQGIPIEWKPTIAEQPLLRRTVSTSSGVATSATKAVQFHIMSQYNIRLGLSAGLEHPFRFYTLRRGAGEVINKHATAAERMQIMGHDNSEMFQRHYLNQIITTDTSACFLGTPSRKDIMKLAAHMSLTRDTNAPTELSKKQKDEVRSDPAYCRARSLRDEARAELVDRHRRLDLARVANPTAYQEYQDYCRLTVNVEKQLIKAKRTEIRKQFFASAGAWYLEQHHRSQSDTVGSAPSHKLPHFEIAERNVIRQLLFEGAPQLSNLIEVFRALCRRISRPSQAPGVHFEPLAEEHEGPNTRLPEAFRELHLHERFPDVFPVQVPGTLCLFCLGDGRLNVAARTYSYARRACLTRHVDKQHLRHLRAPFICPHPTCSAKGVWLQNAEHFKNHAYSIHNVEH